MHLTLSILSSMLIVSSGNAGALVRHPATSELHTRLEVVSECLKPAMDLKSCDLSSGDLALKLRDDKIWLKAGTKGDFAMNPSRGSETEWTSVRLLKAPKGKATERFFLELLVWGAPSQAGGREPLEWSVFELVRDGKLVTIVPKQVLSERRRAKNGETESETPRRPFGVFLNEKAELVWKLGPVSHSIK